MRKICFDTNIVIWGIKNECTEGQEDLKEKAKNYINFLNKDSSVKIIIPVIVISEAMIKIPYDKRLDFIHLLQKSFEISVYDIACSLRFAEVWDKKKGIDKSITNFRDEVKADYQILATALVNSAHCIITHDKNLQKFAEGIISATEIPDIPHQPSLNL